MDILIPLIVVLLLLGIGLRLNAGKGGLSKAMKEIQNIKEK